MHNELKIGTKCKNLKSVFTAHFFGNVFSLCRPTQGYQKIFPTRYFLPLRKTVHCPKMTFFLSFSLLCYVKNIMTKLLLIWWLMILFFYRKVKWQQNWIDLTMRCCCHHHFLQCYFVIDYMHRYLPYLLQHCIEPKYKELYTVLKARISNPDPKFGKTKFRIETDNPYDISSPCIPCIRIVSCKTMALLTGLQHSQY